MVLLNLKLLLVHSLFDHPIEQYQKYPYKWVNSLPSKKIAFHIVIKMLKIIRQKLTCSNKNPIFKI